MAQEAFHPGSPGSHVNHAPPVEVSGDELAAAIARPFLASDPDAHFTRDAHTQELDAHRNAAETANQPDLLS